MSNFGQLLHGLDVARTVGVPWAIPPDDALLIAAFMTAGAPLRVDPGAAAGLTATMEVSYRGDGAHTFEFRDGALETELSAA